MVSTLLLVIRRRLDQDPSLAQHWRIPAKVNATTYGMQTRELWRELSNGPSCSSPGEPRWRDDRFDCYTTAHPNQWHRTAVAGGSAIPTPSPLLSTLLANRISMWMCSSWDRASRHSRRLMSKGVDQKEAALNRKDSRRRWDGRNASRTEMQLLFDVKGGCRRSVEGRRSDRIGGSSCWCWGVRCENR